jgi:hypothetical protein
MVITFLEWLLIGTGVLLGLRFLNGDEEKSAPIPVIHKPAPVKHKLQPGDITFMQNASPYNYEPDGNLL